MNLTLEVADTPDGTPFSDHSSLGNNTQSWKPFDLTALAPRGYLRKLFSTLWLPHPVAWHNHNPVFQIHGQARVVIIVERHSPVAFVAVCVSNKSIYMPAKKSL